MPDKNQMMIDDCPDDAVILDIGANHGKYTVKMAKHSNRKIYAFEPEPENIKKLRNSTEGFDNVEIHEIAIGDEVGITQLMLHPGNQGGHSIHHALDGMQWKHSLDKTVDVSVMTLDRWCSLNSIDRIDGIKIDVEAHEIEVIRGAMKTLKKFSPRIALETHKTIDCEELRNLLQECGYDTPELQYNNGYYLEI